MRRNRIKDLDTVFILGAGASYACSLPANQVPTTKTTPLDKTFNRRILDLKSNKTWVKTAVDKVRSNWIGEIKDFESMGLEESIIQRIGNYELLKVIHPIKLTGNKKIPSKIDNADYVNYLSHLIVELLSKCRQNYRKNALRFAQHVYGSRNKIRANRIITFNYDTLLDDLFLDEVKIPPKKLYFDRVKFDPNETDILKKKDKYSNPLLLKLHGSTNWRVSSSTYAKIINGELLSESRPPIWLDRNKTPNPSDDISPLIMPPLPYKPITTTPIFSYLWECAFEYLHETKRIVIAGYSCPQTDSFAMSMLSLLNNMNLEEVIIIDPDSTSLNKYRNILNGKIRKNIKWTYFADFIDYLELLSS